jgi:DNA-binding GntR family transcriptional regulator
MHELAVRESAANLSTTELAAMRAANERFTEALRRGDVDAALAADDAFHDVPVLACANGALRAVLEQFTPVLRRVERLRFSSLSGRGSPAQHERIVALCEAGDVEGAAAATRANWQTLGHLLAAAHDGDPT